ncbi:MipA/OmpV family protein [Lysobacter tyrosinilyticus]
MAAEGLDKPYADYDTETYVLPFVSYESRWISASLPKFDIKLNSSETLSFRLRASVAGDGYDAKDSPALTGMKDRKFSLWAGGAVVWNTDFANFTGEVLTDAGGKSKGTSAKLQMDRRFAAGSFGFTPRLVAEWIDDKYVDYYYGVEQSEVLVDRPFYEGKATTNAQVGLTLDYNPAEHHTVFLDAGFTRYGSAVEDSPLVDKPNLTTLGLGYSYRF